MYRKAEKTSRKVTFEGKTVLVYCYTVNYWGGFVHYLRVKGNMLCVSVPVVNKSSHCKETYKPCLRF